MRHYFPIARKAVITEEGGNDDHPAIAPALRLSTERPGYDEAVNTPVFDVICVLLTAASELVKCRRCHNEMLRVLFKASMKWLERTGWYKRMLELRIMHMDRMALFAKPENSLLSSIKFIDYVRTRLNGTFTDPERPFNVEDAAAAKHYCNPGHWSKVVGEIIDLIPEIDEKSKYWFDPVDSHDSDSDSDSDDDEKERADGYTPMQAKAWYVLEGKYTLHDLITGRPFGEFLEGHRQVVSALQREETLMGDGDDSSESDWDADDSDSDGYGSIQCLCDGGYPWPTAVFGDKLASVNSQTTEIIMLSVLPNIPPEIDDILRTALHHEAVLPPPGEESLKTGDFVRYTAWVWDHLDPEGEAALREIAKRYRLECRDHLERIRQGYDANNAGRCWWAQEANLDTKQATEGALFELADNLVKFRSDASLDEDCDMFVRP